MSQPALSVPSHPRFNVYTAVTNKIVEAIEAGPGEYRCPWHAPDIALGLPVNAVSHSEYRGVNILSLWIQAMRRKFRSNFWATYKQWQSIGAQVRYGESGTLIVFYKQLEVTPLEEHDPDQRTQRRYYARPSWVFNASQVDRYEPPAPDFPLSVEDRSIQMDALLEAVGAKVRHGCPMACYRRDTDEIEMPEFEWFLGTATSTATEAYYSVRLHETIHWTGAEHRLNRTFGKRFGDEAYAIEELIAELGAAFGCAAYGIANDPRPDHAAYLAHWLSVLKQDSRAIFTAASAAQEAFEYLVHRASTHSPSDVEAASA